MIASTNNPLVNIMAATVQRKCKNKSCGALFTARTADVKRGWALFCSKSCKAVRQEARTGQYREYQERVNSDSGSGVFGYRGDWC